MIISIYDYGDLFVGFNHESSSTSDITLRLWNFAILKFLFFHSEVLFFLSQNSKKKIIHSGILMFLFREVPAKIVMLKYSFVLIKAIIE